VAAREVRVTERPRRCGERVRRRGPCPGLKPRADKEKPAETGSLECGGLNRRFGMARHQPRRCWYRTAVGTWDGRREDPAPRPVPGVGGVKDPTPWRVPGAQAPG